MGSGEYWMKTRRDLERMKARAAFGDTAAFKLFCPFRLTRHDPAVAILIPHGAFRNIQDFQRFGQTCRAAGISLPIFVVRPGSHLYGVTEADMHKAGYVKSSEILDLIREYFRAMEKEGHAENECINVMDRAAKRWGVNLE